MLSFIQWYSKHLYYCYL